MGRGGWFVGKGFVAPPGVAGVGWSWFIYEHQGELYWGQQWEVKVRQPRGDLSKSG